MSGFVPRLRAMFERTRDTTDVPSSPISSASSTSSASSASSTRSASGASASQNIVVSQETAPSTSTAANPNRGRNSEAPRGRTMGRNWEKQMENKKRKEEQEWQKRRQAQVNEVSALRAASRSQSRNAESRKCKNEREGEDQAKQARSKKPPPQKLKKERVDNISRNVDLTAEGRARSLSRVSRGGSGGPSESRQSRPLAELSPHAGAQDSRKSRQLALECQREVLGKIKREAQRARLVGLTEEEVQEKLKREEESQQELERELKAKAEQEQQRRDFEAENCCPICIDVFEGNVVKCHKCNRAFCEACIERWLAEAANSACVWCRGNPRPLIADSNLTALAEEYRARSQ